MPNPELGRKNFRFPDHYSRLAIALKRAYSDERKTNQTLFIQITKKEENLYIPLRFNITTKHFNIPHGLFKDLRDERRTGGSTDRTGRTLLSAEVPEPIRAAAPVTGCRAESVTSFICVSTKFLICLCLRDNSADSLLGFAPCSSALLPLNSACGFKIYFPTNVSMTLS